jgi:hypothetical protein
MLRELTLASSDLAIATEDQSNTIPALHMAALARTIILLSWIGPKTLLVVRLGCLAMTADHRKSPPSRQLGGLEILSSGDENLRS